MAVPLEIGILHLLAEFLADALVVLGLFEPAGTVAPTAAKPLADLRDKLLIFIQTDGHMRRLFLFRGRILPAAPF